jgi:uncharacterized membrane protein YagU involved in acid resistance
VRQRSHAGKGFAAGLLAGLVASCVMNGFQTLWGVLAPPGRARRPKGEPEDDTTVRTASAISEGLFARPLGERQKRVAGPVVHYAFGTVVGGLYGATAERIPAVTAGSGLPFGAAFWLVADETAVPLLRLAGPPGRYPLSVHLYALVSHLVFGWTAEAIRRRLRGRR